MIYTYLNGNRLKNPFHCHPYKSFQSNSFRQVIAVGCTASHTVEQSSLCGGEVNRRFYFTVESRSELCSTSWVPSKLQYCVYVLLSMHDGDLYVGFTTDLKRRLTEHFHGESKATAPRRPFRLIFCEYFFSKKDAERREMYLKTTAGRKGLKLCLRETLHSHV